MRTYDITFAIVKNSANKVVGFSLMAGPQTEAECFVQTMPRALKEGTAQIEIKEGTITFSHPTCPIFGGDHQFQADAQELAQLQEIVDGSHGKVKFSTKNLFNLGPAFKIVLESEDV